MVNFKKDIVYFGGFRRFYEEEFIRDFDVWSLFILIERDNRYVVKKFLSLCDRLSLDVDNRYVVKLIVF